MKRVRSARKSAHASGLVVDRKTDQRSLVEQAVKQFQSGSEREESFRFLYLTFFSAIERFFARKGISPEDCLDLTQKTFLGIYKGLDGFRGESRFETWLYRVATSTHLKSLRSKATMKRAGQTVLMEDAEAEPALRSPAVQLENVLKGERAKAMSDAVERLPQQMRNCLTLRLYHQLAYREIAEVMKLNIETVKVHLFKARKRLRKELDGYSLGILNEETESPEC